MPFKWIPMTRALEKQGDARFRRSLVRNVLVALLLLSLLPVALIGTLYFFRTRSLLEKQINSQLESIVAYEVESLEQFIAPRETIINLLVTDERFNQSLYDLLHASPASTKWSEAAEFLTTPFLPARSSSRGDFFDQMLLLTEDGNVLLTTDAGWLQANFGGGKIQHPFVRSLIGTNQSIFVYNPTAGYINTIVLFTSRSLVDDQGNLVATMITTSTADLPYQILSASRSFLPGSSSYFFTAEPSLISTTEQNRLIRMDENPDIARHLVSLIGSQHTSSLFTALSHDDTPVIAYATWRPDYNLGVLLTVSQHSINEQNILLDPFNLVMLAASLVITGTLIFFGASRLVSPIMHLTQVADSFSRGNWSERAHINRRDEIGLLAYSFNHMADELSELYQSLEAAVEKRTNQLRMAAEVAQLASSTATLDENLRQTVDLMIERFGFYHVAIFLVDETGQAAVLRVAGGFASEASTNRKNRISVGPGTLVGWVATHNKARVITDIPGDPLFEPDELLPDTRAVACIPIALGNQVLGLLVIHSTQPDVFDADTVSVFQTLANQLSSTLHNTRLLEAAQISYEETTLLYQATRQVTQARNEAEVVHALTETFVKLPFVASVLSVEQESIKILFVSDSRTGRVDKSMQNLRIPTGQIPALLAENRMVLVEDLNQSTDFDTVLSFLLRRGCQAAALIGIFENKRITKLFAFGAPETGRLTHAGLQPYANLAEVVGSALEKYHVLNTLQQRLAELQILANFSQSISAETNLYTLYRVLHQQVIQTFGADLEFAVALYDEEKNEIAFPYFFESGQLISIPAYPLGEGLTSLVIRERKPLLLPDEQAIQALSRKSVGRPARSWLGVPLLFAGDIVGAVILQDLVNENRFNQDDVNLFSTLAPQIATAVRNAQLFTAAEEALHAYDQERFLLNTLLDHMPEEISFKDPQGKYIRASHSLASTYGTSTEDLIGKTVYDLMDGETAEQIAREEQAVMERGEPEIGLVERVVSRAGSERWIHISRIPIRTTGGEPFGLLVIQHDVTSLKQAEALAQRRAGLVTTSAEIARDATGTLDVNTLLQKSVTLVRERFGYYHASIFLVDPAGEYAVLRESTGEAGRQMLQTGHRLAVGSKSIVGQVTETGSSLIVNDVSSDPTHFPNPLLPETRSELAIPLKVGERVLGALDVQSTEQNAFDAEDVSVLQILADQLAVAVVNGELFARTQELLGKHRLLRQLSIAASASTNLEDALVNVVSGLQAAMPGERIAVLLLNLDGTLQAQVSAGYEGTRHREMKIALGQGITGQAAAEKRPIRVDDTRSNSRYLSVDPNVRSELAIPILFNEELLGVLNLESTRLAAFDENDQEILGALGNNLGGVIANLRLVNQVRQQINRERQLFEATSKIRRSVDLETILEISTQEIARALGARRARVQITAGASPLGSQSTPASNPGEKENNGQNNGQAGKP